ncbi:MAG: gamma-glutamyl-gamma-aminobutyrate hydrolase family protein [Pseudomonadota bacterium]
MSRPLIGITCSRQMAAAWSAISAGRVMEYAFADYGEALSACGAAPVIIPVSPKRPVLEAVIDRLDALLLSGGPDVHPRRYGQMPAVGIGDIDEDRDRMELEALALAESRGLAVLAVCRGIQLLNVSRGGSLFQDIAGQRPESIGHRQQAPPTVATHTVSVVPGTMLQRIVRKKTLWVNGRHHQGIAHLGQGLAVSATAPDGLVEAVEDPTKPFLLGIQWHPEGLWRCDPAARRIFSAFVAAAAGRQSG